MVLGVFLAFGDPGGRNHALFAVHIQPLSPITIKARTFIFPIFNVFILQNTCETGSYYTPPPMGT